MTLDKARVRHRLKAFNFKLLFTEELGWDNYTTDLPVEIDEECFTLQAIAEKRDVVAFTCAVPGSMPPHAVRRKIDRQVAKSFREHFIIYVDGEHTEQIWQWVRREVGRPLASREHHYNIQQPGDSLIQKLDTISFSLKEEPTLILFDVTSRVRAAFNVEQATKKFYDRFTKEREAFQGFLEGIPDEELERWYVSVMLNRLMFIYFIQKKGFLDGDPEYLRHKLAQSQARAADHFYLDFLCPLFFEGFANTPDERSPEIQDLLGDVPFLNGGIFQRHEVEQLHGQMIQIPDAAFAQLFDFFDCYQWHLDDRPLQDDREINPDVLGYIFEKYINQKQMGAYYTKEDITEYISKNTIIPFLFGRARKKCRVAFEGQQSVWSLLAADPDRYIYEAVRKGTDLDLPPEIAAGIDDVSQRGAWNTRTPEEYALPTEIWRETVARRHRYEEVWLKLVGGEVRSINDLITYNLDIQQFAQDVIDNCEGPELLRAFWRAINQVTVLDPTCGSGAFLFAALNILEPLYEACLHRMEAFVAELAHTDHHPHKYKDFREILDQMERHPNRSYFVLKSIVVNNLYGVDIMAEAVEIAKLRLFLKLVAQVDRVENIEPLPDIDFNIRSGNSLVGFASREEVERAMRWEGPQSKLLSSEDLAGIQRVEEKAEDVDRLFEKFRSMQTAHDMREYTQDSIEAKEALRKRLKALEDELNRYLAQEYGVDADKPATYEKWLASHQPFHWFTEFYGILKQGGFDVIIGNPPYVEYSKVHEEYRISGYSTEKAGNLYAFTMERSFTMLRDAARFGMIVQLSSVCTDRMRPLQDNILATASTVWISNYDDRPAKLFHGLEHIRASIVISQIAKAPQPQPRIYSTNLVRWYTECRLALFQLISYGNVNGLTIPGSIPKIGDDQMRSLAEKVRKLKQIVGYYYRRGSQHIIHYHRSPLYWVRAMDFMPIFKSATAKRSVHHFKDFHLQDARFIKPVGSLINSSLFYLWFIAYGNGRNVALRDIQTLPCDLKLLYQQQGKELEAVFGELMEDYKANSGIRERRDGVKLQVFYPSKSKPVLDKIDCILARYYDFSDNELDFIINYDIKYRMGDELFHDGEEEED